MTNGKTNTGTDVSRAELIARLNDRLRTSERASLSGGWGLESHIFSDSGRFKVAMS